MIKIKGTMTLDKLGTMVANGFADMATKADLNDLKTEFKKEIGRLDKRLAGLEFKVDELRDMLIHLEDVDILDLQKRVQQLEQDVKSFKKQAGFK